MALPRFLVIKSNYNNNYLRYIQENVKSRGFLKFSGEEVVSPFAKFEVEPAKTGNGLVHLRCCYNNKYWVIGEHSYIVAGADEPEEDQSKWSSTLFKPIFVDGDAKRKIRFKHVRGRYACLWRAAPPHDSDLCAGSDEVDKDGCNDITVIDWESLVILPKHVAFKGDNDRYLSARWIEGYRYLQFDSNDLADPTVGHQIFTTKDGNIRIKSDYFGKFWRRSPNWIWADSDDTTANNSDTVFQLIKVDDNVIALRNLGNNNFCKRLTTEGKTSCLNAAVSSITWEARLVVVEPVISRKIYNVNYRVMDARIYKPIVHAVATEVANNQTAQTNSTNLKFSFSDIRTKTWNSSVSLKLGVKTTFEAGVPLIGDAKIEISAEFTGGYSWGETITKTEIVESQYTATVPANSKVKVTMIVTTASCDIPFSYTVRETLTSGEQRTYDLDDGIFTGANSYNFQYDAKPMK